MTYEIHVGFPSSEDSRDPMVANALRLLKKIELQPHYLWSAAHDPDGRALLENYAKDRVLKDTAAVELEALRKLSPQELYDGLLRRAYAPPENFADPALGALYWAIVEAVHETMLLYRQQAHEPLLNGALLANIRGTVSRARSSLSGKGAGLRDLTSLAFSDQAAMGNEALSGADFGIIFEVRRGDITRLYSVLIQAKRAHSRQVDVRRKAGDSTQWQRLQDSGIGAYLFYNEFGPRGALPMTIKSATLVGQIDQEHAVDPLRLASEFASWLAFGMSRGTVVGPAAARTREDALGHIFNAKSGWSHVNDLLVTVLDEERLAPAALRAISIEWEQLVATARNDVADGRRPVEPRPLQGPRRPD